MRILYVIDERGLTGGAHVATELLITALRKRGYTVDVMEAIRRNSFWGIIQRAYFRFRSVLPLSLSKWMTPHPLFLRDPFCIKSHRMKKFDTVCVMAENSSLSEIVALLPPSVRKVQMIHTNYPAWAKVAHRDVIADGVLFEKFDCIACVGIIGARQFEDMFPRCKGKVLPFHNIIEQELEKQPKASQPTHSPLRLISLARINDKQAKDGPRMIRIAKRLSDAGLNFIWDNYGGRGVGLQKCQKEVSRLGLENVFRIHPYDPDARMKIASADLFVLLSHYEGLPNVIYEALLAGIPVFSTNVGGISEQIDDGSNGWLVKDDEESIVNRLSELLSDASTINKAKCVASEYVYDNDKVISEQIRILTKEH